MTNDLSSRITKTVLTSIGALIFLSILLLPGWTWSLYDELHWAVVVAELKSPLEHIIPEFKNDGRFWPLAAFYRFFYYNLSDFNPVTIRALRGLEFALLIALVYRYLRQQHHTGISILFALLFFMKSPPQLEQLRWMTLVEEFLCVLVVLGLLTRKKSKIASYGFIGLAILGKEPFILFLSLPSFLEKKWREFAGCLIIQAAYLGFFILNRRGYTANAPLIFEPHIIKEILIQGMIDIAPVLPFLFFVKFKKCTWHPVVFMLFSIAYFILVAPKTWGYTYILMPSIFMFSISIAGVMNSILQDPTNESKQKLIRIAALTLSILFFTRVVWNWSKVYDSMKHRKETINYMADHYKSEPIATTCHVDYKNIGYAADLKNGIRKSRRKSGNSCPSLGISIRDCCKASSVLAIGRECDNWKERSRDVEKNNYPVLYSNKYWILLDCNRIDQSQPGPRDTHEHKGP